MKPNVTYTNLEAVNPSSDRMKVAVTDIEMPFGSMVIFMIKWALASIPATMILLFTIGITIGVMGLIFGGLSFLSRF